ncbi:hypothetical protein Ancab_037428 [Ancistrocladus abbreviatus]
MSSPLNYEDLYRIFESLDQNRDGLVSVEELNWLLERTGHGNYNHTSSLDELVLFMRKPIAAAAAALSFDEFCHLCDSMLNQNEAAIAAEENHEESDLYEAFKVFDLNNDGFISPEEIRSVLLRFGLWNGDCTRIIHQYDTNSDGFVDFEEFKRMMLAA